MSKENFIKVERTARIHTHGTLSNETEQIWVVAHGYGMLSEFFIKKFEELDPQKHFIIAPEGLSRGYLENMTGRIGASWMTKEMREEEISDYLAYLDRVVNQFVPDEYLVTSRLIAFGFSQGAATISRWVHHSSFDFQAMVICGGAPAKELFSVNSFANLPLIFAFGDKDVYLNHSNKESLKEQSEEKGWSFQIIHYQGGHQLTSPLLSNISEICKKL